MTFTQTEINVPVDGTITPAKIASGDFYFDTDTLYIDSTNNRVGIGTTSPSALLHAAGDARIGAAGATSQLMGMVSSGGVFEITTSSSVGKIHLARNVGIGTSSPDVALDIEKTNDSSNTNVPTLRFTDADTSSAAGQKSGQVEFFTSDTTPGPIGVHSFINGQTEGTSGLGALVFGTGQSGSASEKVRIDSSGNVGIGNSNNFDFRFMSQALSTTTTPAKSILVRNGSARTVANQGAQIGFQPNSDFTTGSILGAFINAIETTGGATNAVDLTFGTGTGGSAAEKMRIDSSGNVGIGNNNPSEKLTVEGGAIIAGATNDSVGTSGIFLDYESNVGYIKAVSWGSQYRELNAYSEIFKVNTGIGGVSERMRIDSSGNVLFGVTTLSNNGSAFRTQASNLMQLNIGSSATSTQNVAVFRNPNGAVGTISTNGSATAYNTSSDARLKEITGEARGLEVINALNPVAYNWKADGQADEGLIAQEVEEIVPNAVLQNDEEYYQMDYSKLVVHLVKGMKEQQEQIESLKNEIELLKGEE